MQPPDLALQLAEDLIDGLGGVDQGEVVALHHRIQGLDQAGLVAHEALIHIRPEPKVHTAFPVVERAAAQHHPRYQVLDVGAQVEDRVRRQRKPGHLLDPPAVFAARNGPGHDGENVAVDQHHETGAQGGHDLVLQPVREIGGVEQGHGDGAQGVAFLGHLDALARQRRARHAGIEHGVAFLLQPLAQLRDLRAAAHRVGPLDDDQLALQVGDVDARERLAIELERLWLAHWNLLPRPDAECRSSNCRPARS